MIYYQDDKTTLIYGDNREELSRFAPISIDLVVTDPPYTDEVHDNAKRSNKGSIDVFIGFDSITEEELRHTFDLIGMVARGWVIATMAFDHTFALKQSPPAGLTFVRAGVWVKPNTAPHVNQDRPPQGWESIAMMHQQQWQGKYTWNGGNHSSVYTENFVTSKNQRTPGNATAKPRPLYGKFIQHFSNPGDTVLDPYCGSGTLLWAARLLGRKGVGIEIDERQCDAIARSLSQNVMDISG